MSSMIKKKGALTFKPKAPQPRRQAGAPPSAASSTRPNIERQSHTPVLTSRPIAFSPPLISAQLSNTPHEQPPLQDVNAIHGIFTVIPSRAAENSNDAVHSRSDPESDQAEKEIDNEVPPQDTEGTKDNSFVSPLIPTVVFEPPLVASTSTNILGSEITNALTSEDSSGQRNADLSILGPEESIQTSEVVPTAELNPDGSSGAVVSPVLEKSTKRPYKRRKLDKSAVEVRQSIEVQVNKPSRVASGLKKARKSKEQNVETRKRTKRRKTPEDAEDQEINHSLVKMSELTKDLRIGRKFSRHEEIKKRQREKKIKATLAKSHLELTNDQEDAMESQSQITRRDGAPPEASSGPQMRIVNGQIVIDDSSLVVDRHARAAAEDADMEVVEEDDFTRITTSGTHMKREMNIYWDGDATEKFYSGIRMFGTDFEMISKMFPDRTRRQIKLKFNKEEREFPRKISSALTGEAVKIDLEEYKSHTGLEYEATDDIEAAHAQLEADHQAEQVRLQTEADETTRQKRAEIQASVNCSASRANPASAIAPVAGTDSAKENEPIVGRGLEGGKASAASKPKKQAASKKKRKNIHGTRGGGEEVEVLGSIDDI